MDKQQLMIIAAIAAAVWYLWPYVATLRPAPAPFLPPPALPPLPRQKKPTLDERVLAYQVMRSHLQATGASPEEVARLSDPLVPYLTRD